MDKRYGILIVSVTILVLCFVGTTSATNLSVDGSGGADFSGIQDAINNASAGDTILVHSGVYYENVVVNKSVTLKGIDHPVVDANGSDSAITLTVDGITLEGFNATNSGSSWSDVGIKVTSNNNTITGNNVSNNSYSGIYLSYSSNNNTITGNTVSNNRDGISLDDSSNNIIIGNVFVNDGLSVYGAYQNIVEDNTVNGKPLVYLEDISDYKVEDAGQVIIVNCNNISIENLDLSNTDVGIPLWRTENSKISNNTVCSNKRGGIRLDDSSNNNTITGNTVSNNNGSGIYLTYSSSNNTITGNSVSNNNGSGIYLTYSSSNNTITGNNVSNNNDDGIDLWYSSNNKITDNNVSNNRDGISLGDSSNNKITDNNVSNNRDGIRLDNSSNNIITGNVFVNDGLSVYSSYQNIVEDNTVNGKPLVYLEDVSDYKVEDAGQVIIVNCNNISIENLDLSNTSGGVALWKTENSKISNNTACNNSYDGIRLSFSSNNNTITGNIFVNDGLSVYSSYQNTVEENTVNGKPLVYLEDVSDYKVEDAGQVILVNCDNITVENLDLSNTSGGIALWKTKNSKISNNTVCNNNRGGIRLYYSSNNNRITGNNVSSNNNGDGIYLVCSSNNTITGNNVSSNNNRGGISLSSSSNNNTITGNNVSNNDDDGIFLWSSSNNKIYFNNFINNTDNVDSYKSTNIWNSPLEITYTYDGTTYKSYLGNYWNDYRGTNTDGDGIGDTHYSIDSKGDESDDYPLMKPFENYILPRLAPT